MMLNIATLLDLLAGAILEELMVCPTGGRVAWGITVTGGLWDGDVDCCVPGGVKVCWNGTLVILVPHFSQKLEFWAILAPHCSQNICYSPL